MSQHSLNLIERLAVVLASVCGSGFTPKASGTAGTLVSVPVFVFAIAPFAFPIRVAITLVVFLVGVWASYVAERVWNEPDSSKIVIDEMAGFFITMLPFSAHVGPLAAGFGLFRLFDILKPWPCNWLDQNVHGGWGVMLDDGVAGIYALLALLGLDALLAANELSLYGLGA